MVLDGICHVNNKEISNCKTEGTIDIKTGSGGITRENNGVINNCINEINIESSGEHIAGIAYSNNGIITNSCNKGKIHPSNARAGIVGNNNKSGVVKYCCNFAEINLGRYGYVGGGICWNNYGTIENCYNAGVIECGVNNIGGIVGCNMDTGIITNCYNIGNLNNGNSITMASIVGSNSGTMDKCFCLDITSNSIYGSSSEGTCTNSEAKSEEDMKDISFIELLNSYEENVWKSDDLYINKGYPILNWQ